MSERAKTVGNNKGSPRSELVVSQQNTAANNIKRSRISKKADSVSSLSGNVILLWHLILVIYFEF